MSTYLSNKSKHLAYLLRHSSLPNQEGWLDVSVLFDNYGFLENELDDIVEQDVKGRFDFSKDKRFVRALYGHSNHVALNLESSIPPAILYHGTATKYLEKIREEGLRSKSRNYVHLSEKQDDARIVGIRHGDPIVLKINVADMVGDGLVFYKCQSGIWLTQKVDAKYLIIE